MKNPNHLYLKPILKRMLKNTPFDIDTFDFDEDMWFTKYKWSEAEEKEFKDWLIRFYHRWPRTKRLSRFRIVNSAEAFVFQFGWSRNDLDF